MHRLSAIIVILCEAFNVRGDWYSADVPALGDSTNFNNKLRLSSLSALSTGFANEEFSDKRRRSEHVLAPIFSSWNTSEINQKRNQNQLESSEDYYHEDSRTSPKPIRVNYNNTINLVNVVKKVKNRRKVVNRCPNQRGRRKKLAGNQTARTKFLEVFEVVHFENVACTSSSGLEGTCLHEYECDSSGGVPMGTCADGYGTCCVILFSCDEQSSAPMGWFTNPGFPSPSTDRLSCTVTLNKASEDIQQIRLDFLNFELLAPNAGTCQQDQFVVSGQNINSFIPILCGINTGQHVYIEVGETDGPIYMSVQTVSPENRLYSIKVTQLTSSDDLAAPTGCLQYFTQSQGILESFNYRDRSEIGIPRVPSYLNNLNYVMCIRRARESCSVTYTNADYLQIVNYDLDGLPVIPQGQAGVEIFNCPGDWLLMAATRLCGDRLNDGAVLQDFSLDAPVTDNNAGPIAVWFRTDEGYVGQGFKLQYQQNACNGSP